jgi:acyl-CoA oxidase
LSREELYAEMLRKHIHAWRVMKKHNLTEPTDLMYFLRLAMNGRTGLALHDGAFVPTLRTQASDEQLARWLPLVESFQMIGCYAQTELGHGTFVRGLETTATYDPKTKEFVLITPQITSAKWLVGGLGKSANYTVLLAQLYTQGRCQGVHPFLLRLRDENHNPLPGITVGDIGPKFGYNAVDNGFLRLDSVRIPRENMLMRYSKVLEDGTYIKPENDKIVYSGMLSIRATLPLQVATMLAKGVAIAIRYSCVRRQSELTPGQREPQVLDFQTQQHKLLPLLATAYAYKFAGLAMLDMFLEIMSEVKGENYRRLIEAHALSSGMKAVTTTNASAGIETCRLACGGHGYLQVSRLPELYTSCVAVVTAEGDATILLLQTAKYLLKNCMQVQANKKVDDFVSYLSHAAKGGPGGALTKFSGSFELDSLLGVLEFRALRSVTCRREAKRFI